MLEVTVNNETRHVAPDFGSNAEAFLDALGFEPTDYYVLYRVGHRPDGAPLRPDDRCGEPFVVDDGDEFAVVPWYVGDG